jgi:hypothetical protein
VFMSSAVQNLHWFGKRLLGQPDRTRGARTPHWQDVSGDQVDARFVKAAGPTSLVRQLLEQSSAMLCAPQHAAPCPVLWHHRVTWHAQGDLLKEMRLAC